ncbi:MAG: nitrate ABC transporter ATP-binding protein [Rhizobiaceae bacterium MnEN-MB40S]|nr:MAG: nitrate ABC transporter ATP-binding protein [Rhizobiaceae bacterium MnEN-MB40S]
MTALIEIKNVSKIYATSDDSATWALQGVSVNIEQGEFICAIGPSGCGKTTLLNIIGGFITPTEGDALLNGNAIQGPGPDRGVVFQEYALFSWLTSRENIEFPMRLKGVSKADRRAMSDKYLEMINLTHAADRYPGELSGGMRQRVAVARALVNEPQLLLMDEPFAAVDAMTRTSLQEEVLRLWEKLKFSVLFITHNIEEAVFLSSKIIIMSPHPGRIKEIVPVDLPYPRDRTSPDFGALYAKVNEAFHT